MSSEPPPSDPVTSDLDPEASPAAPLASTLAEATGAAVQTVAEATQQAAQTVTEATQQAAQTVAEATQQAAQNVVDTAQQAQATVQQVAQQATVSPRRALYRGRRFAIGYALLVAALTFLATMARRYKILPGDVGIARRIQHVQARPVAVLMALISELGWQWPSVIMRLTTGALMWQAGFRMEGAFVIATWSGDVVTVAIKETVGRPRPTRDLVRVVYNLGENSFPSGHVVHYVTFYGFVFYILWTHLKQGAWRNVLLTLLALLVLLIGPSRVYQGAHWPSDVGGAYLVGSIWLGVLIIAYLETKARYQMGPRLPFLVRRARDL